MDEHGNMTAHNGCDVCFCGCKYWKYDYCIDCNTHIETVHLAQLDEAEYTYE